MQPTLLYVLPWTSQLTLLLVELLVKQQETVSTQQVILARILWLQNRV